MILAGDVGGTKANLGLFDVQQGVLAKVAHKRYGSREHAGLEEIAADFITSTGAKVTAASFGVAGPIVNNRVKATNIPWIVDGGAMAKRLGVGHVRLLNDLEAYGYGIGVMGKSDLETLHRGVPAEDSNSVVIAAGTGLGECILVWNGRAYLPVATEGGHSDFAPNTVQQAELWKFLQRKSECVPIEAVLSGRGFQRVHEFLDPSVRHNGFNDDSVDAAPEITTRGLAGTCPVCVETLNLWVEIYGAEAGNLALRAVARGGIYVGGGIAAKILPKLKDGKFVAAVKHKHKMEDFIAQIPVRVVLNEQCPMFGAAFVAWKGI
jgi:glucokinase